MIKLQVNLLQHGTLKAPLARRNGPDVNAILLYADARMKRGYCLDIASWYSGAYQTVQPAPVSSTVRYQKIITS